MMRGHSLLEMLVVLALLGVLATAGIPWFADRIVRIRLLEVRVALLEDGRFMARHFLQTGRYLDGRHWPVLPVAGTAHYLIGFCRQPAHAQAGKFRLYASVRPGVLLGRDRVLSLDQDGVIREYRDGHGLHAACR